MEGKARGQIAMGVGCEKANAPLKQEGDKRLSSAIHLNVRMRWYNVIQMFTGVRACAASFSISYFLLSLRKQK